MSILIGLVIYLIIGLWHVREIRKDPKFRLNFKHSVIAMLIWPIIYIIAAIAWIKFRS